MKCIPKKKAQEQTLSKCIVEEESLISYCAKVVDVRAELLFRIQKIRYKR